jgi:hypothetical protein
MKRHFKYTLHQEGKTVHVNGDDVRIEYADGSVWGFSRWWMKMEIKAFRERLEARARMMPSRLSGIVGAR